MLALEVEPESRLAGGAAYLSAPDAPELAWIPFDMREPMPDAPVAPQVHLLSEPLDERQREAVFRDPQPAWRLFVDLAFSAGGLVLREGMPRAWFATLTPDENGVRIGPWLELPLGP